VLDVQEKSSPWLRFAVGPLASWLQTAPGFSVEEGPGWWRVGCEGAKPDLNCLAITGENASVQEALAQGFESILRVGRPAIICVAAEYAAAVVEIVGVLPVRGAGMLPHYLLKLGDLIEQENPPAVEVEQILDLFGFDVCMSVLTAAFDDPYDDPHVFGSGLLGDPRFTFRLARVDGIAVSTVVTWRQGDIVYVTIMATDPSFQGRGIGRNLLQQALLAERSTGASHAHLVSSEVGAHLYRAAGFRLLANHPLWQYDGAPGIGF